MTDYASFEALEFAGWQERAATYDAITHRMTGRTIPALTGATRVSGGARVLDVCCGTGAVARSLKGSGANIDGIDFAPDMISVAQSNVPDGRFQQGDAQQLPFDDACFDTVLTNFGHYHLSDPVRAVHEAARVLRPGGRYGFTTWLGPDRSPGFKLIFNTIMGNIDPHVPLPKAPDPFRLADEATARRILSSAGFTEIAFATFNSSIVCKPDDFVSFLKAATVRATLVLKAQPVTVQERIERLLYAGIEAFVEEGNVTLPMPNLIVTATRKGLEA